MKPWFLLFAGLSLCAGELTIYRGASTRGRIGQRLFVDGRYIGKIKGLERVALQLPDGKHLIRINEDMDIATMFDLKGSQILRFNFTAGGATWTEALLADTLAKEEFEKTKPMKMEPK